MVDWVLYITNEHESLTQVFSCKFCKIFKKTFFTEHLWTMTFVSNRIEMFIGNTERDVLLLAVNVLIRILQNIINYMKTSLFYLTLLVDLKLNFRNTQ